MPPLDSSLLTAALAGYAQQKGEIEAKIAAIKQQLGEGRTSSALGGGGDIPSPFAKAKRRGMSAAAKRRIAAAQKKRWAAYRKRKAA